AVVVGELQPRGRGLVDDDGHIGVQLQDGRGPAGADRALGELGDAIRLAAPGRGEDDPSRLTDGAQALAEGAYRDVVRAVEVTGVVLDGGASQDRKSVV